MGKHNINSYAVKVNGSNQVTVRNKATLRKIPKPVPIHIPVIESDLSRPAMEPRSVPLAPSRVTRSSGQGDTVAAPLAPSRVTRSMGQGDPVSRQNTLNTLVPPAQSGVARPEVQGSMVSRQGLMKKGPNQTNQAFYEDMEEIADWDYPGNIVRQALHKPPAPALSSHVADSGQSHGQAGAVQPVQSASPRVQPAGAGAAREVQDRLASKSSSQGNDLVVQDSVGGQLVKAPQILSGSSPSTSAEVGPQEIRRSGRQRSQLNTYQAGTSGM